MKAGDKVYCIKSFRNDNGRITHFKKKTYTIDHLDGNLNVKRVWIKSEDFSTPHGYLGYVICGKLYSGFHYFTEHFLTSQEFRKLKLKKLKSLWKIKIH